MTAIVRWVRLMAAMAVVAVAAIAGTVASAPPARADSLHLNLPRVPNRIEIDPRIAALLNGPNGIIAPKFRIEVWMPASADSAGTGVGVAGTVQHAEYFFDYSGGRGPATLLSGPSVVKKTVFTRQELERLWVVVYAQTGVSYRRGGTTSNTWLPGCRITATVPGYGTKTYEMPPQANTTVIVGQDNASCLTPTYTF
ncbi:MAG: hypothetical protein QM662_00830 [Gordonia sp. (in: high G+C Gram-positive bacteria)]